MTVNALVRGDHFTLAGEDTPRRLRDDLEPCTTSPGRVHLHTDAGDWCIPGCVTVSLVERGRPAVAA